MPNEIHNRRNLKFKELEMFEAFVLAYPGNIYSENIENGAPIYRKVGAGQACSYDGMSHWKVEESSGMARFFMTPEAFVKHLDEI